MNKFENEISKKSSDDYLKLYQSLLLKTHLLLNNNHYNNSYNHLKLQRSINNKNHRYSSLSLSTSPNYTSKQYEDWLLSKSKSFGTLPDPALKLTKKKQIDYDLRLFNNNLVSKLNQQCNYNGYLNIIFHFLEYNKEKEDDKERFHFILRLDGDPIISTSSNNTTNLSKIDFNDQFNFNINSHKTIDILLISSNSPFYYSSQLIDINSLVYQHDRFYFKLNLKQKVNSNKDAILYASVRYYPLTYSVVNKLLSNKNNSKIFSLPLDDIRNPFDLILGKCMKEIEMRGLFKPFIYQLNAIESDIKWTFLQFECKSYSIIQQLPDINVVANVIIEMLKELDEPLMNLNSFNCFNQQFTLIDLLNSIEKKINKVN
jgi:hypothetical protein